MKYAGFYGSMGGIMEVFLTEDGILEITVPGVEDYKETYLHQGDGIFTDSNGLVKVSFVKETNDNTYIKVEGPGIYPGLGQLYATQYNGQKIEPNPLSGQVAQAWEARDGKRYYVVDEKYTSQFYLAGLPAYEVALSDEMPGYMGVSRIESADRTKAVSQIPGSLGRDLQEYRFFEEEGMEYLSAGGSLAVSEDAVKDIYSGASSVCTIPESGTAVWFGAGAAAGTTMTVTVPAEGAFTVYNASDLCVGASGAGGSTVTVPDGGMIVFAGEPGQRFSISMK